MIELKPTNLLAVEVPMEGYDFIVTKIQFPDRDLICKMPEREGMNFIKSLGTNDYTILGTVTADEIGFDVEKYVDGYEWEDSPDNGIRKAYRGYETPFDRDAENYWDNYYMDTKDDSFRSILSSSGLPLRNRKYLIIEPKK